MIFVLKKICTTGSIFSQMHLHNTLNIYNIRGYKGQEDDHDGDDDDFVAVRQESGVATGDLSFPIEAPTSNARQDVVPHFTTITTVWCHISKSINYHPGILGCSCCSLTEITSTMKYTSFYCCVTHLPLFFCRILHFKCSWPILVDMFRHVAYRGR